MTLIDADSGPRGLTASAVADSMASFRFLTTIHYLNTKIQEQHKSKLQEKLDTTMLHSFDIFCWVSCPALRGPICKNTSTFFRPVICANNSTLLAIDFWMVDKLIAISDNLWSFRQTLPCLPEAKVGASQSKCTRSIAQGNWPRAFYSH